MSVGKTASKRQIRRGKAPDESLSDTTGPSELAASGLCPRNSRSL
jgi:hypothetical protein